MHSQSDRFEISSFIGFVCFAQATVLIAGCRYMEKAQQTDDPMARGSSIELYSGWLSFVQRQGIMDASAPKGCRQKGPHVTRGLDNHRREPCLRSGPFGEGDQLASLTCFSVSRTIFNNQYAEANGTLIPLVRIGVLPDLPCRSPLRRDQRPGS